jgi:hypothetical protein
MLASVQAIVGDTEGALASSREAKALATLDGSLQLHGSAELARACALDAIGDFAAARDACDAALQAYERIDHRVMQADVLLVLAEIDLQTGAGLDEVRDRAGEALKLCGTDTDLAPRALLVRGWADLLSGDLASARQLLLQSADAAAHFGRTEGVYYARALLALWTPPCADDRGALEAARDQMQSVRYRALLELALDGSITTAAPLAWVQLCRRTRDAIEAAGARR